MSEYDSSERTWRLSIGVLVVLVAGLGLTGCGEALSGGEDGGASSGEESADGKGDIYGEDNRREYFESPSETLRKVGRASTVLVDSSKVTEVGGGEVELTGQTLGEKGSFCPSVNYTEQPAPGKCSGFLVAPDVVVSAGHCIQTQQQCDSTEFAFNFRYEQSTNEDVSRLSSDDVYSCDSIISQSWQRGGKYDYGVYRLDEPVEDVEPLNFRTDGKVAPDTKLAVVGHPMGLPLKIAADGEIRDNSPQDWFKYNLDAFGGHSGAAVVNAETGVVEGIHVRGAPDYGWTIRNGGYCVGTVKCDEVEPGSEYCFGTEGTRATVFAPHVPTATTASNGTEDCCMVCSNSQACGDTCISESWTCREPYGCACED